MKQIILLLGIFCFITQTVFSQHTSKNNYTGNWATPTSWNPTWPSPQTTLNGPDITINGYITVNGSLSFTGTSDLIINDTLVIIGDLSLNDNCDLTINDGGILIVRGNFSFFNHSNIIANGYLIATGNIDKHGPFSEGEAISNDNPVRVFIGGTISPGTLTNNQANFPALDCTTHPTTQYPHSGCSYGDMTDIITDPIYPFFQSTCTTATLTSSDADNSFCAGTSVTFTAGGGTNYNFRVNGTSVQNGGSTTYTTTTLTNGKIVDVIVTSTGGCTVTSSGITNTVFALPTPTFIVQPGATACSATNVTYTTQAGQTSYVWTFTGVSGTNYSITSGGTGTDNNVTLKWLTAGSKTVTINYTNAGGCKAATATSSTATLVTLLPVPTIAGPTPVCVGIAGNVYTTESGMSNYTWVVSAGGTITAGGGTANNSVTVTWTTTGAKTVTVNYTNGNGCTATSATTYNVTVNPLPVPTIAGPTPLCVGIAGNVYTTEAGMSNYLWTVSAGGTITAGGGVANNTVTVTWTTTGAKTVTVNYNNLNGCTATSATTYNVTVNPLPVPTIAGPTPVCVGIAGNVYTTESGMSNYLWTVSAGGTITVGGGTGNNTVTVTWTTTGAKTVTVNYNNLNGCTATSATTYNVTVDPLPVPTIAGPTPVCVGIAGNVYTTEAGMSNYLWTVSAGGTITVGGGVANNTVTVTWTTTGAKTVKVNYTNGNGCTATSATTYNVTVNPLPVPTIAGPTPVCVGIAGNVYTTEAGMSNYLWTVSAGGTITAGGGVANNTVTVTWTTTGAKTVKVNYTNGNGCTATSATTYNVTVNPLPVPTIAGPTPVCVGIAGNVYTTEAGMSNYLWTVSAGGTITAGGGVANNTVTVTWTTTGAKTVKVNYTNGNGCTATSATTYLSL